MRITEREYDEFAEDHFPNMVLLRAWASCKIWSAGLEEILLVLVDNSDKRVAIFEYDTTAEREKDIRLVKNISDEEGGAGIPAFIGPKPPPRIYKNANPLPQD